MSAQGVAKSYLMGNESLSVLSEVELQLWPGECVAIVGASGSGKTTLLQILGGVRQPDAGQVELMGQVFSQSGEDQRTVMRRAHLGFLYQYHYLLSELSALDNIAAPLRFSGVRARAARERALQMLEQTGMVARAHHLPSQLSGGERQRVALGRALVHNPACLLLDEPTGNLDHDTADQIQDLLLSLCRDRNTACLIVTHDKRLAAAADRTLLLDAGSLHASSSG